MKISGMGYAILRVTAKQLRELHTIPADVVFERTVGGTKPDWTPINSDWVHDEHPFYFRIRHRFLPRTPDRGPLMCFTLRELIEQHAGMTKREEELRGELVPRDAEGNSLSDGWVDDDA